MAEPVYTSVADADAYLKAFAGNPAAWTGSTTEQKSEAIVRATQYLDLKYGPRWKGERLSSSQPLDWPRSSVYDRAGRLLNSTTTPTAVRRACAEAALQLRAGEDLLGATAAGTNIRAESKGAGKARKSVEYLGAKTVAKSFPKIDAILDELVEAAGRVRRA